MEEIINYIKENVILTAVIAVNLILIILYIVNCTRLKKLNNNYEKFMKKIGKGTDISEDLRKYIENVEEVKNENRNIVDYCQRIDKEMSKCIQKVGIYRYSAFKDTGSDLSFTLALLDENNNGVMLNGIYSQEMSNIYAKPIKEGQSKYTLSEEEKEAIARAVNICEIK